MLQKTRAVLVADYLQEPRTVAEIAAYFHISAKTTVSKYIHGARRWGYNIITLQRVGESETQYQHVDKSKYAKLIQRIE
jgi:hypothetical protein